MYVLQLVTYLDSESCTRVRMLVDGFDLAYHAQKVERPFADAEGKPTLAGGYGGLHVEELAGGLMGECPLYGEPATKTPLLGCGGCGIEGCWPLVAHIAVSPHTVVWSAFEQPHRPAWNLSALGPFTFDRAQYEQAIRALSETPL